MIYNYKSQSEIFPNHHQHQVTGASLHLRPEGPGEECRSGGEGERRQEGLDHGSSAQLCQEDEHEDHRGLRLLVSNLTFTNSGCCRAGAGPETSKESSEAPGTTTNPGQEVASIPSHPYIPCQFTW